MDMDEQKMGFPWEEEYKPYGDLTEKQWKIFKAALTVFMEKGYSAATTSEIAQKAGVAEGTIFRHFKTKKDILLATLVPLVQNLLGPGSTNSIRQLIIENENLPIEEVLFILIEDRLKVFAEILPLVRVALLESFYHPELREVVIREVALKNQELLLHFLEQRQRAGELRSDLDAWAMARSFFGAAAFYLIAKNALPMREEGREHRQELKNIIDLFLKGAKA